MVVHEFIYIETTCTYYSILPSLYTFFLILYFICYFSDSFFLSDPCASVTVNDVARAGFICNIIKNGAALLRM